MVLAAGFGTRMRPLTDQRPKPLVTFCGKALIDHVLDRLVSAGVTRAVVNAHHFADQITNHVLARQPPPQIFLSDERSELLDTGGGVVHALAKLGHKPFVVHNSDSVWVDDGGACNLSRLSAAWNPDTMDCLMLLAKPDRSLGYAGAGDFIMSPDGTLQRRDRNSTAQTTTPNQTPAQDALVFAGVSIAHPRLFADAPGGPFSMNVVWDHAIANQRLFGLMLNGTWMHIGTPDALTEAEKWIADGASD